MVWIILVLACIACWSTTDLFYKKGSDYEDRLSRKGRNAYYGCS